MPSSSRATSDLSSSISRPHSPPPADLAILDPTTDHYDQSVVWNASLVEFISYCQHPGLVSRHSNTPSNSSDHFDFSLEHHRHNHHQLPFRRQHRRNLSTATTVGYHHHHHRGSTLNRQQSTDRHQPRSPSQRPIATSFLPGHMRNISDPTVCWSSYRIPPLLPITTHLLSDGRSVDVADVPTGPGPVQTPLASLDELKALDDESSFPSSSDQVDNNNRRDEGQEAKPSFSSASSSWSVSVESSSSSRCLFNFLQPLARPSCVLLALFLCMFIQTMVLSGLLSSMLTTLERRFNLSSRQLGYMMSCCEAAGVVSTVGVSFVNGAKHNRLRLIGFGTLLLSLGFGLFTLPHFLRGPYDPNHRLNIVDPTSSPNSPIIDGSASLCLFVESKPVAVSNSSFDSIASALRDDGQIACSSSDQASISSDSEDDLSLTIFCIALTMAGVGASPVAVLGPTYLWDNLTRKQYPLFAALFYSAAGLGPALGFLAGAGFLSVYIDRPLVDAPSSLTRNDSRWLGAWWMGMLACSGLACLFALPLLALPKRLPATMTRVEPVDYRGGHRRRSRSLTPSSSSSTSRSQQHGVEEVIAGASSNPVMPSSVTKSINYNKPASPSSTVVTSTSQILISSDNATPVPITTPPPPPVTTPPPPLPSYDEVVAMCPATPPEPVVNRVRQDVDNCLMESKEIVYTGDCDDGKVNGLAGKRLGFRFSLFVSCCSCCHDDRHDQCFTTLDKQAIRRRLTSFTAVLRRVLTNPIWLGVTIATVVEQSIVAAFIAYVAKYIEGLFQIPAYLASVHTGAVVVPSSLAGIITGALIMRHYRPRVDKTLLGICCAIALTVLTTGGLMAVGCGSNRIAGLTADYTGQPWPWMYGPGWLHGPNLTAPCNANCKRQSSTYGDEPFRGCSSSHFSPVCWSAATDDKDAGPSLFKKVFDVGINTKTVAMSFFNPCFAGCRKVRRGTKSTAVSMEPDPLQVLAGDPVVISVDESNQSHEYYDCSCVTSNTLNPFNKQSGGGGGGRVTNGRCVADCPSYYLFLALLFVHILLTGMLQNPSNVITLSCVESSDSSVALGLQLFFVRVLASLPAPIYFGQLFDLVCQYRLTGINAGDRRCTSSLSGTTPDLKGACLHYNTDGLPLVWLGTVLALKLFSLFISTLTWRMARRMYHSKTSIDSESPVPVPDSQVLFTNPPPPPPPPPRTTSPSNDGESSPFPAVSYDGLDTNDIRLS